jgi:hypothetical protein
MKVAAAVKGNAKKKADDHSQTGLLSRHMPKRFVSRMHLAMTLLASDDRTSESRAD